MSDWIELDPTYSTTRRVRKVAPEVVEAELKAAQKPEDQFEMILFQPEGEGRKGKGGLRTNGYFKKSSEEKPLITIITVVFNGEKHLEETILSVINQTYDNVEYIIIDGGSSDGTLDIVRKYEHAIDYWVSEKDKGVYDAMNKGIDLATGEWINFMNGGDVFYKDQVINQNLHLFLGNPIIVFGKSLTKYGQISSIRYFNFNIKDKNFYYSKMPNHQAVFLGRKFYKKEKYDIGFEFSADTHYLRRAFHHGSYVCSEDVISIFHLGGMSNYFHNWESAKKIYSEERLLSHSLISPFLKTSMKFILMKLLGKDRYLNLYLHYLRRIKKK